ncbi:MAG: tetratricopeptide repeat protein [Anaerolineae bacterium]|nr:tetratricopeptide repeat protein [Anaerolineae bacterium]MBT7071896.1 tetratricopeptide repeat protein [Anaerolineae bacterium]
MNRRRRRINWFWVSVLVGMIFATTYFGRYVAPEIRTPFIDTPTPTRAPESFVSEAENLFGQGKFPQAITAYEDAIRSNPSDPSSYIAMARVQVFIGHYEEAQESAENALLLNPNNSIAHAVRAWALDFQGELLAAEAAVKRSLELDPNNALAHAYYAEILADSFLSGIGPFDSVELAAEESRVALSLAPDLMEAHRARAYVLEVTGNYEEAIRAYEAAININDNIPDLHLSLGRNYRALQVYDKAVEEFTRANALNPADPLPDLFISRTYSTIGEYAKAVQYGEQAVKDDPESATLHGNLGVMYYHNFLWPEAAQELALSIYGGNLGEGQTIEALPLSNTGRSPEYYFTYALVLSRLNRCGESLQIAQQIIGTIPSNELAVFNANEAINLCQENLDSPPIATEEVIPEATETPTTEA